MTAIAADLLRRQAFVDGAWIDADSGETFPVVDPATGETIADVPRLGAAETRRAIAAAEAALPAWKHAPARERARVLRRLADLMADREEELAALLVTEQGKPLAEARAEIQYALSRDLGRITRVGEALEYGILGVNTGLVSTEVAPFGGMKESGIGREGSSFGIEEWVELKYWAIGGVGEPL